MKFYVLFEKKVYCFSMRERLHGVVLSQKGGFYSGHGGCYSRIIRSTSLFEAAIISFVQCPGKIQLTLSARPDM